ncbi:MAG: response regulator transcription factor [Flavobacteriales bacterium]|nr:response regulator transcription factor [Flavobacteriales bacterium]
MRRRRAATPSWRSGSPTSRSSRSSREHDQARGATVGGRLSLTPSCARPRTPCCSPMSAGISRRVLASFSSPRKASREIDRLGALEDQILEELSLGLRYKEIDDPLQLSIDTVRTQVRNLYDKLHVSSRTDALNMLHPR